MKVKKRAKNKDQYKDIRGIFDGEWFCIGDGLENFSEIKRSTKTIELYIDTDAVNLARNKNVIALTLTSSSIKLLIKGLKKAQKGLMK